MFYASLTRTKPLLLRSTLPHHAARTGVRLGTLPQKATQKAP
jgi:hypothetical protein